MSKVFPLYLGKGDEVLEEHLEKLAETKAASGWIKEVLLREIEAQRNGYGSQTQDQKLDAILAILSSGKWPEGAHTSAPPSIPTIEDDGDVGRLKEWLKSAEESFE